MWTVSEKTAVTLIGMGLFSIAVSVPLLLGRIRRNRWYGFRLPKAFQSEENWRSINEYGARVLIYWSVAIMCVGVISLFISTEWVMIAAKATLISVILPILFTMRYTKNL